MQDRDQLQNNPLGTAGADHGHASQGFNPAAGRVSAGSSARLSEQAATLQAGSLRIAGGSAARSAEAQNLAHSRPQDDLGHGGQPVQARPSPLTLNFGPRNRQRIFTPRPVAASVEATLVPAEPAGLPMAPANARILNVETYADAQQTPAFSEPLAAMQSVPSPSMKIAPQPTQPAMQSASQTEAAPSRIASIFRSFFAFGERKHDSAE